MDRSRTRSPPNYKDRYDNMQYSYKILLNSIYGFFGYQRSRLYDVDVAQSVTAVGRDTLLKTKTVIENNKKYDLKVIAGDTDSVFISLVGRFFHKFFIFNPLVK